ncbi:MAG: gfo/Idh/MocA family oxidoreductase, partial [Clostridia bacterium]|nr:gfo/Idh/MocA family oxidoreductase [Clostridia bacterium]
NVYIKNYLEGKTLKCATASMVWNRDEKYYATAKWRGKWATEGGGTLINQALHTMDLLQTKRGE